MTKTLRRWSLMALALWIGTAGAQDGPITPESFAAEASAPTFQLLGAQMDPVAMIDLVFQCLDSGAQTDGLNLIVYGFSQVDGRLYRLQGPRALETALRRAEIQAQAEAVEFFNAVVIEAQQVDTSTDSTATQGAVATTESGESFSSQLSTQLLTTLTTTTSTYVSGSLRGGRTTGTKLISLGDQGMCVGVRYQVPLDQSNFDPVERARTEADTASPGEPAPAEPGRTPGFVAPPPGSIGDF